jgi:hypothetical protein
MSVAARLSSPFSARSRMPPRTSTVVRDETALETIESFWTSSSLETLTFIRDPTMVSMSVILFKEV